MRLAGTSEFFWLLGGQDLAMGQDQSIAAAYKKKSTRSRNPARYAGYCGPNSNSLTKEGQMMGSNIDYRKYASFFFLVFCFCLFVVFAEPSILISSATNGDRTAVLVYYGSFPVRYGPMNPPLTLRAMALINNHA